MAYFLAFDYGTSSIGVAVGQEVIGTAQPLVALKCKKGKFKQELLDAMIKEWQPSTFVLGFPLNQDGTPTHLEPKVKRFAQWLIKTYGLKVFFVDERNSTTSAKDFIFEHYGYKGLTKEKVDSVAAAIILQSYFDGEEATEFLLDK